MSKATQLAGLYEAEMWPGDMTLRKWGKATVEELRRIEAINAELLAALNILYRQPTISAEDIIKIDAAITKATGEMK